MRETQHLLAGDGPARLAVFAGLGLGIDGGELFFERSTLFLVLHQRVDAADGLADAGLQHLFGDLFLVEDHHFLDVAHAALEVFAEADDFADHDGRARDGLHHAHLAALDALGDFDFALAREQRHGAHLAQVHADGVVGFFECARGQVELDVFALFAFDSQRRPRRTWDRPRAGRCPGCRWW